MRVPRHPFLLGWLLPDSRLDRPAWRPCWRPPPGFLNTDWRSGFADSNPSWLVAGRLRCWLGTSFFALHLDPSCPQTVRDSPSPDLRSPAERLNGKRYNLEWLQNLLVSASLSGYRRSLRKAG